MPPQAQAQPQSQYVQLPNGEYGEFDSTATDADIRAQISKDFPDAFKSAPSIGDRVHKHFQTADNYDSYMKSDAPKMLKRPPMREGMVEGYERARAATPNTVWPQDMVTGAAHDVSTLTRAGYQSMLGGKMGSGGKPGKRGIIGEPPSEEEFLGSAKNVGGMMLGEAIGTGGARPRLPGDVAPRAAAAAPEGGASSSPVSRLARSSDRVTGAAPGGMGSEFASDMADLLKPKWMKAAGMLRKWGTRAMGGDYPAADPVQSGHPTAQPEVPPRGFEPGRAAHPADDMSHQGVPFRPRPVAGSPGVPESTGPAARLLKAAPDAPVARPPRPAPAWQEAAAHRTRSVGEQGVPFRPESHAQATASADEAASYGSGRESVTGQPQETVRIGLDKSPGFSVLKRGGGQADWVKFHGDVPESAVTPPHKTFAGMDFSADAEASKRASAELAEGKITRDQLMSRAQFHKDQIRGAGMSGARPATEVPTPAQVTPQAKAGDTFASVSREHSAVDAKDGGQMGHPTAVGRLAKAPTNLVSGTVIPKRFPMTGKSAVGDINPRPRKYYPEDPTAVNDVVNNLSGEKRTPVWKLKKSGNK